MQEGKPEVIGCLPWEKWWKISLWRVNKLSRQATLPTLLLFCFLKGSTLNGKNLLQRGANTFLLDYFLEGNWGISKVTKVVSLLTNYEIYQVYSIF